VVNVTAGKNNKNSNYFVRYIDNFEVMLMPVMVIL